VEQARVAMKVAQNDLDDTVVKAPFAGLITRRFKGPGDFVSATPPTEVFELVAIDRLEAELRLPEAYLASVQAGKTPVVVRSSLLKAEVRSTVSRVIASVEKSNGTFAVRVALPADSGLPPGAFVTAEVRTVSPSASMLVPARALGQTDKQTWVCVAVDGKVQRRSVELGDRLTECVVLKGGVRAGEKVLVGPVEGLADGAALPAYLATATVGAGATCPATQSTP
jgi:RND family efflux transporter MFP subunit